MNVHLTPRGEAVVRRKVEEGHYATATDVVEEGLRLLEERDLRQELLVSIQEAEAALDRGEGDVWSEALMDRLRAEAVTSPTPEPRPAPDDRG
jgi:antitoxin ParD1/3/4